MISRTVVYPFCLIHWSGMDEEGKRLLRQNLELGRENNKMLKRIRRDARIGLLLRILWIAIIVGVPVFLYFTFLQQYVADVLDFYGDVQSQFNSILQIGGE